MPNRRDFLTSLAALTAFASSTKLSLGRTAAIAGQDAPPLPSRSLYDQNQDAFWEALREQYLIPKDEVYLNNGTVGSSPWPVLKGVFNSFLETEKMDQEDPEQYPIWGYEPYVVYRDALAQFVGATRDQIALTRNATESNNYIANGLDLRAGDEVLISDQEHPGGEEPWNLRAKRYGIVVKKFELPKPPKNAAEILNRINDAITPRTRIIFVSHISTVTGVVLPVKEIAALARSKGIISALDGAHVTGMMRLNINELGCDLYTSSPHKWLQAPKGSGFLYLRDGAIMSKLWSTIATHGWDEPQLQAERFQHIGSSNVPLIAGLRAAIEFATWIGMDRIEKRHRELADLIYAEMMKRGAESWTSPDPALRCGIVTVNVPPAKMPDLEYWMWKQHKIRIRGGAPHKVRLSTPYYLQKKDIQRFLETLDRYKQT
ncbi:MAG TPA: aminotransferase class V-fold PLP-dependent enzyme [Candidatus Angelobacter sp.]|nr:aminotransferase class V-fold PLP-dependent enzyme [Candidatus Angelobacter sp.]